MNAIAWAIIGRRAEDRRTNCLARLMDAVRALRRRTRARQALAQIDHRTLRDAGIDPVAAQYEAKQPFWVANRRLRDC